MSRRQRHGRGSHARTTNEPRRSSQRGAIFVAMPLRRTLAVRVCARSPPPPRPPRRSTPWATVNVCDTAVEPGHDRDPRLDARRRPPSASELFMRFQVQYQRDDGSWRLLSSGGDSGFIDAGRAPRARLAPGRALVPPQPAARRQRLHAARPRHVRVAREGRHRRAPRAQPHHRRPPLDRGRRPRRLLRRGMHDDRMMRRAVLTALAVLARAAALPAHAREPGLWATINMCDPPAKPGAVGVRISIPAHGTRKHRQQQWVRIRIQWYDGSAWQSLGTSGDTGYKHLGHGRGTFQGGTTFTFDPPGGRPGADPARRRQRAVARRQEGPGPRARCRRSPGTRTRRTPALADVAGDLPDQPLTNSRGSLEMIPVTPRRSSFAIRAGSSTVQT